MTDRDTLERLSGMQMDDVLQDPNRFGAPTFEEFKKNRERFVGRDDEAIASVSNGSHFLKEVESKYRYEIEGYRCKTLEEVERVASSQGIALKELEYRAMLMPQGAGKADLLVKFMSKSEYESRASADRESAAYRRRLISQKA